MKQKHQDGLMEESEVYNNSAWRATTKNQGTVHKGFWGWFVSDWHVLAFRLCSKVQLILYHSMPCIIYLS